MTDKRTERRTLDQHDTGSGDALELWERMALALESAYGCDEDDAIEYWSKGATACAAVAYEAVTDGSL